MHMASYLLSALNTFVVPALWVVECPFMSGQMKCNTPNRHTSEGVHYKAHGQGKGNKVE